MAAKSTWPKYYVRDIITNEYWNTRKDLRFSTPWFDPDQHEPGSYMVKEPDHSIYFDTVAEIIEVLMFVVKAPMIAANFSHHPKIPDLFNPIPDTWCIVEDYDGSSILRVPLKELSDEITILSHMYHNFPWAIGLVRRLIRGIYEVKQYDFMAGWDAFNAHSIEEIQETKERFDGCGIPHQQYVITGQAMAFKTPEAAMRAKLIVENLDLVDLRELRKKLTRPL